MLTNILILLFSSGFAALLFKFGLPTARDWLQFRNRMLPAFGVLLFFLLINLGMALLGKAALQQGIAAEPIRSLAALEQLGTSEQVILVGKVSEANELLTWRDQEFVAFFNRDRVEKPLWLQIDLSDGLTELNSDSYKPRNWPSNRTGSASSNSNRSVNYLERGQAVVISGRVGVFESLAGADKGGQATRVTADLVYAGSHDSFVANLKKRLWGPRILASLNAFAIGAIGLRVAIAGFRRLKRRSV